MRIAILLFIISLSSFQVRAQTNKRYKTDTGDVHFLSDAPLEKIEASSHKLNGILDPVTNKFAFSVQVRTFKGFNSPLQQEHFYENYLETPDYPVSTFKGKIIEEINYHKNGTYFVRAKGVLLIHGVPQERIINSKVVIDNNTITISSNFTVLLADHNITIPRIVKQKIAEEILVDVKIVMTANED